MNIQCLNPAPRWSDATVYNGVAQFVEVPNDTSCTMAEQIAQVLIQAEVTLAALGSDKSRCFLRRFTSLIKITCPS